MGKIDCNGKSFVTTVENPTYWFYHRIKAPTPPRVVWFAGCKNVKIEDVTMVNQPAGWSYWIHDCDYVTFHKVKIFAEVEYPNNDGIHINSSRNVTISDCDITCGDDSIIVRANNASLSENKVCEKVTVTNCNLTSYASGIRLGWINDGIIRNCTFSNIVMTNTTYGIQICLPGRGEERLPDEGREDTLIENISFSNIVMDKIFTNPVRILIDQKPVARCEAIRNIYFDSIHANARYFNHLQGRDGCPLGKIVFSNCSFLKLVPEKMEIDANTVPNKFCTGGILYADDIVYNNTSFRSEV
jgi:polygalacturonase